MIKERISKPKRRVKVKPAYWQGELAPTSGHEHYVVINHFMDCDENTGKYYWHSSQITWRQT